MTRTGHTLDDVPARVSYRALLSFVHKLDAYSASVHAQHPDLAQWLTPQQQTAILADIYDAINMLGKNMAAVHGVRAKRPKPYPRPGKQKGVQKFGQGAIPISQFDDWWNEGVKE